MASNEEALSSSISVKFTKIARRPFILSMGILAFLLFILIVGSEFYDHYQAASVLREFRSFDSAVDPTGLSLSFTQRHKKGLILDGCYLDRCQRQFLFTNRPTKALHLAPRADMKVYLTYFRGKLVVIALEYTSAVFKENSPIVYIQEGFCKEAKASCNYFYIDPHGRRITETWRGDVSFGQQVNEEQKEVAWALNLDCVTSFSGCRDISQLLPRIWKSKVPGTVSSLMRSMADSLEEASQPLDQ